MNRNYKAGYRSNNRIRYNRIANKKTINRYIIEEKDGTTTKVTTDYLYVYSVSNQKQKELNYRNNNYKVTEEDYYNM